MATPENTFIGAVHRHIPVIPGRYHMKNHNAYVGGVADMWYSAGVSDLWIEYKFIKVPVRDSTIIDLIGGKKPSISDLQQEWLRGRHLEGRNVGVLVGSKAGGVWFPGVEWDRTYSAKEFRDRLKTRQQLAELIISLTG